MNKHVKDVCRIGQGSNCCRYLMVGAEGFECARGTSLKALIDSRAEAGTMVARGDNCEGKKMQDLK